MGGFTVFFAAVFIFGSTCLAKTSPGVCPDDGDFVLGSVCFELAPFSKLEPFLKGGDRPYSAASKYCTARGKVVGAIRSADEQQLVANASRQAGFARVVNGLLKKQTLWKWVGESSFFPLSNQGCYDVVPGDTANYTSTMTNSNMTVDLCKQFCLKDASNLIAATFNSTSCLCSKSFRWTSPSTRCVSRCPGTLNLKREFCGAIDAVNVFQIAIGPNRGASALQPFDNWYPAQPSRSEGACAVVVNDQTTDRWIAIDCSTRLPFICQYSYSLQDLLSGSDDRRANKGKYKWFDNSLYVLFDNTSLTFFNADHFCMRRQGRLASLKTRAVADLMSELMKGQSRRATAIDDDSPRYWIGATGEDHVWPDGTGTEQFDAWYSNQDGSDDDMSAGASPGDCVQMSSKYPNYEWTSVRCADLPSLASSAGSSLAVLCSGPTLASFDSDGYASTSTDSNSNQPQAIADVVTRVGPVLVARPPSNNASEIGRPQPRQPPQNNTDVPKAASSGAQLDSSSDSSSTSGLPGWGIALVVIIGLAIIAGVVVGGYFVGRGRWFLRNQVGGVPTRAANMTVTKKPSIPKPATDNTKGNNKGVTMSDDSSKARITLNPSMRDK